MYVSAGRGVVVRVVDEHTDVDDGRRLGVCGVERGWPCTSYITSRGRVGGRKPSFADHVLENLFSNTQEKGAHNIVSDRKPQPGTTRQDHH